MIQVCSYAGCGIVYGEKEPFSDKSITHGLCPKHYEIRLQEIKAELAKAVNGSKEFRVLIVEDSPAARESLRSALRGRFGALRIDVAAEGTEALQKMETIRPDLIFMDIRLPGENGLALTGKIKVSHPDIIIVIFTNYDLPEYREAAKREGADYFLLKDSPTKDIFKLIESILPVPV